MSQEASKNGRTRRNETMKFAYSGPFAPVLIQARVRPARDLAGNILTPQPRYAATSPERYTIGTAIGEEMVKALAVRFGSMAALTNRPKSRRAKKARA